MRKGSGCQDREREREREGLVGQKEMGKASGCTFQNSVCIFLEKTTVKKNLKTTTGGAGGVGADV